jgi:tetratricopeptide (TPR) repeat protein
LPLEEFWSVLVHATEAGQDSQAVNHVEQMHLSACYQGRRGPGQLGCVSCHDPHERVQPARRVAHYRARCLQCHHTRGCSEPLPRRLARSKQDSCIDCHMPYYSAIDVAHTAATDHRIPRRPGKAHPSTEARNRGATLLTHFYPARRDPADREGARDLGIGLVQAAQAGKVQEGPALRQGLRLLDAALMHSPDDLEGWEARATALFLEERPMQALTAFAAVLARAPRREAALAGAAAAAQSLGRMAEARGYWRRAVTANPWFPAYRRNLAVLAAQANAWDEAWTEGQAWLRLDPGNPEARMLAVSCLWRQGRREQARAEFARLEALRPPDLERFRKLFAGLPR